ncbi:MAG: hypothetical protein KKC23_00115 [Proteobacteria bacterium]|nr:hypothetical protein [Pseudomonadota bacterium]
MTKAELVEKMASEAGISKVAASGALNSFMDEEVELLRDPEINQIKAKSKHKSKQNFPLDKNFC